MRIRRAAAVVAAFLLTGCFHAVIQTGRPESSDVITIKWANSFVYGLVPPPVVETAARCTNGVAKVETQQSFLNILAHIVTFGHLYPDADRCHLRRSRHGFGRSGDQGRTGHDCRAGAECGRGPVGRERFAGLRAVLACGRWFQQTDLTRSLSDATSPVSDVRNRARCVPPAYTNHSGTTERSPNPLPGSTPRPRLAPNVRRSPDRVTSLRARLRPAIRDRNTMRLTNWMPRCPSRWTAVRDFSRRGTPHLHVRSRPCARDPDSRPPLPCGPRREPRPTSTRGRFPLHGPHAPPCWRSLFGDSHPLTQTPSCSSPIPTSAPPSSWGHVPSPRRSPTSRYLRGPFAT